MRNYKYYIDKTYLANNETLILELKDQTDAPVFAFKPGQYVMISYINEKGGLERKHAFSIASAPTEKDFLRLGIKIGGKFTQGLAKKRPGGTVFVTGPFGNLTFNADKHQDLVVIAGGIGITPFFSTLKYVADKSLPNKLSLIYSNKTIDRTIFYKEIKELAKSNKNINTLFALTDQQGEKLPKNLLTERLNPKIISEFVGYLGDKHFFICGPEKFMVAMNQHLLKLGVAPDKIEMEGFSMIAGNGFSLKLKNFSYTFGFSALLVALAFYLINNLTPVYASKKVETTPPVVGRLPSAAEREAEPLVASATSTTEVADGSFLGMVENAVDSLSTNIANAVGLSSSDKTQVAKVTANQVPANKPVNQSAPVAKPAAKTAAKSTTAVTTNNVVPTPTTSASIPAETTTAVAANSQTATTNPNTTSPSPVTSASAPAATTPTTAVNTPTTPSTAQTTPTPTTSASAPAASTTPTTPTTSTVTPAPVTPVVSATRQHYEDDD